MADIWGSSNLGGGGSSTATLPDQITNLACVGGTDGTAGTIDISFTEVSSTSWDLLKNYVVVYKEGSIPQTPFDGTRIVLSKSTAGATKTYKITGLTFDQLYGVRIYPVSIKNQYQTLAEGATATATPVNGINISSLSVTDKIAIPVLSAYQSRFGNEIIWQLASYNHYGLNQVTLITQKMIALMCIDAKETTNPNSDRASSGNNRFIYSNQRQWLNSSASAGQWYASKHTYDAIPNNSNVYSGYNDYDQLAGFLAIFPTNFVNALLDTLFTVTRATVDGGGTETFTSKMSLPSATEVNLTNVQGVSEGSVFSMFSDNASRIAYPTQNAVDNSEYKTSLSVSSPFGYFLRTAALTANSTQVVWIDGTLSSNASFGGDKGIRPICNTYSNFKLKAQPREDGCYEPLWV